MNSQTISAPPDQKPWLRALQARLDDYRSSNANKLDIVSALTVAFEEFFVREAIANCRANDVPEQEILTILGENANLAEGGTAITRVFTMR